MKTSAQVLIVDNNPDDVRLVRDILESAGFGIHVRTDGVSAIEAFHAIHPDLVLIDAHIPEASGLEVSREINQTELGRSTPIVLISDEPIEPRRRAEALKGSGLASFLEKPLEPTQLLETMARLLPGAFIAIPATSGRPAPPTRPIAPAPAPATPRPAPRAPTRSLSPTSLPELDAFDEDALGELLDKVFPENDSGDVAAVLTDSIGARPAAAASPPAASSGAESFGDLDASLETLAKTVSTPARSDGFDLGSFHDSITDVAEATATPRTGPAPQPSGASNAAIPPPPPSSAAEPLRASSETTPAARIEPHAATEPAPPATTYSMSGSAQSKLEVVAPRPPKPAESIESIPIAEIDEEDFTRPLGSHVQARTTGTKMHSVKVAPPVPANAPGTAAAPAGVDAASGRSGPATRQMGVLAEPAVLSPAGEAAAQPRRSGGTLLLVAAGAAVAIAAGVGALFLLRSGRSADPGLHEEPAPRIASERPVTEQPLIPEDEGSGRSPGSPAADQGSAASGIQGPAALAHAPGLSPGVQPGTAQPGLVDPLPASGRGSSSVAPSGSLASSKGSVSAKPSQAPPGSATGAPRSRDLLGTTPAPPGTGHGPAKGDAHPQDASAAPAPEVPGSAGSTDPSQPAAPGPISTESQGVAPPAETVGVPESPEPGTSIEGRPTSGPSETSAQGEDFVSPVAIRKTSPIYPLIARSMKTSGTVKLLVKVEEDGAVSDVRVTNSVSSSLDKAAVAAVRGWKYTPAKRGGLAVGAWVEESVVFNLR